VEFCSEKEMYVVVSLKALSIGSVWFNYDLALVSLLQPYHLAGD